MLPDRVLDRLCEETPDKTINHLWEVALEREAVLGEVSGAVNKVDRGTYRKKMVGKAKPKKN